MTATKTKPCGRCGLCDLARFRAWRERIATLGNSIEDGSPRMVLIQEINADVARRYPLGIAVRLNQVIASLAAEGDDDTSAETDLEDLEWDEDEGAKLNPHEVKRAARTCSVAREWRP